jgi:hypothetical protein
MVAAALRWMMTPWPDPDSLLRFPSNSVRRRSWRMSYSGDKYQYCSKERKETKWVRCPSCGGKGGGLTTQCNNNCDGGYKCENGPRDRWHS